MLGQPLEDWWLCDEVTDEEALDGYGYEGAGCRQSRNKRVRARYDSVTRR